MKLIQKIAFKFGRLTHWLKYNADLTSSRMVAYHIVVAAVLTLLWYTGTLGKVFLGAGVFAFAIAALAVFAAGAGIVAARRLEKHGDIHSARKALEWMNYADNALLAIGFLGTLQGAIIELTAINIGATGAAMQSVLRSVIRGVGVAIYSTLAGTAAALWTSVATKMFSNALKDEEDFQLAGKLDTGEWDLDTYVPPDCKHQDTPPSNPSFDKAFEEERRRLNEIDPDDKGPSRRNG